MAAITHAHTGVMPNRPHDYIYDSTFTVSSHKDHVKQMTRSQAQQVVRETSDRKKERNENTDQLIRI